MKLSPSRGIPGPSLSFRVCVFFAANPDEELKTSDVQVKYSGARQKVRQCLIGAVEAGWLATEVHRGQGKQTIYRAGPELLKAIGR